MLNDRFLKTIQVAINEGDYHLGIQELTQMRRSLLSSGKQTKDSEKLAEIVDQIKRVDKLIDRLQQMTVKSQPNHVNHEEVDQMSHDELPEILSHPFMSRVKLIQNQAKIKKALMDLLFATKENSQQRNVLLIFGHEKAGKSVFFHELTESLDIQVLSFDVRDIHTNHSNINEELKRIDQLINKGSSRRLILIDHLDDLSVQLSDLVRAIKHLNEYSKANRPIPIVIVASNARRVWSEFFSLSDIDSLIEFQLPDEQERSLYLKQSLGNEFKESLVEETSDFLPYQLVAFVSSIKRPNDPNNALLITQGVSDTDRESFDAQVHEFHLMKMATKGKDKELDELILDIHASQSALEEESTIPHDEWENSGLNKEVSSPDDVSIDHQKNLSLIENVLNEYGIHFDDITYVEGLAYTRYKVRLASGERIQKITKSYNEIKMRLQSKNVRIVAPIDREDAIGIELPNEHRKHLSFREISVKKPILEIPVGKDINNQIVSIDFSKDPHFLVGGSTGSGKSVNLNVFIAYILMHRHPDEVQLLLIDPKRVEFSIYADLPHSITPRPVNEIDDIQRALEFLMTTMDNRYKLFEQQSLRNIQEFNTKNARKMPYLFAVVDEFATLSENDDIMDQIQRLSQLARAAGIHILLATQRPSTDIVKGTIKNNFTGRIAFKVSSNHDSKTTIYESGAEDLIGKGDMLIANSGESVNRAQGAFISIDEIKEVIKFAQNKYGSQPQIKRSFKE
jgi:hypothetical protein